MSGRLLLVGVALALAKVVAGREFLGEAWRYSCSEQTTPLLCWGSWSASSWAVVAMASRGSPHGSHGAARASGPRNTSRTIRVVTRRSEGKEEWLNLLGDDIAEGRQAIPRPSLVVKRTEKRAETDLSVGKLAQSTTARYAAILMVFNRAVWIFFAMQTDIGLIDSQAESHSNAADATHTPTHTEFAHGRAPTPQR